MKISVVIPYYNAENVIVDALKSVVTQSPSAHQIICVNDGSTDQSEKQIQSFIKQHPHENWILISQENKGLGAARNAALKAASGDYVAWLDADDAYQDLAFTTLNAMILDQPHWVTWQALEWDGLQGHRSRFWRNSNTLDDLLIHGNPFLPSAAMLRRDIALEFPHTENRDMHGAEDLDLWIRLMTNGFSPLQIDRVLTKYRIHSGSMSQNLEHHMKCSLAVLDAHNINDTLKKMAIKRKYYELARVSQRQGNHKSASHYYRLCEKQTFKVYALRFANVLGLKI